MEQEDTYDFLVYLPTICSMILRSLSLISISTLLHVPNNVFSLKGMVRLGPTNDALNTVSNMEMFVFIMPSSIMFTLVQFWTTYWENQTKQTIIKYTEYSANPITSSHIRIIHEKSNSEWMEKCNKVRIKDIMAKLITCL